MTDFKEILDSVPDWDVYFTVDELHQNSMELVGRYPNTVELIELGKSRNGESIDCLRIGNGKYNALIHGFPNPEEPYGGNLIEHLSRSLAENDALRGNLDFTWYLIKCCDPDGARLNQGFAKGPFTPINFTRNYYRTSRDLTGETTFPYRFGPLDLNNPVPETRAFMKLMDRIPFDYICSLHMMKWGGVSYQVPGPCPELYPGLMKVAKDFDIVLRKRLGAVLAPGILKASYFTPARNYVNAWTKAEAELEPPPGCEIFEYGLMKNPNLFMMVPECCIWSDPRLLNDGPSESTVWNVLEYSEAKENEGNQFLLERWNQVKTLLTSPSPFKKMLEEWIKPIMKSRIVITTPKPAFNKEIHARKATVAEKLATEGRADLYCMFYLGGLIRAIDHQLKQEDNRILLSTKDEVEAKLIEYNQFMHNKYQVTAFPIRNLVGMSLGAILHSINYVKYRKLL